MKTSIGCIALLPVLVIGALGSALAADKTTPPAGSPAQRTVDKATPELMKMTGRVAQVDGSANTFTITVRGKQHTFVVNNFKMLPKVGEVVDVTYAGASGTTMRATTVKGSKSNTSE